MVQVPHKQLDLQITNSHTFLNTTTKTCTKINSYLTAPYTQGSLNSSFHSPITYTWAVLQVISLMSYSILEERNNQHFEDLERSISDLKLFFLKVVLGWGENRKDGKQREENRMKNVVFHCLVGEGKWGRQKTWERVFSPKPTFFILPNQEENVERKVL